MIRRGGYKKGRRFLHKPHLLKKYSERQIEVSRQIIEREDWREKGVWRQSGNFGSRLWTNLSSGNPGGRSWNGFKMGKIFDKSIL